jgi:hypothetical protein
VTRPLGRLVLGVFLLVATPACEADRTPQALPLDPPGSTSAVGGGACGEPDVGEAVVVVFGFEGSCVAGDVMVLYRCSAGDVPVLRLSSERGPVAFLGGPYAVPVTSLPANVRFAGSGAGMEVLIADPVAPSPGTSPSLPAAPSVGAGSGQVVQAEPLVYVRHEDVTERWLRLARPRSLSHPPLAWLIGDSILFGGQRDVADSLDEGWSVRIDAEPGRPSSSGVRLAEAAAAQDADVVLVELGTNDSSEVEFRDHLIETLEILRDVPFVVWQTARGPEGVTIAAEVNAAVRAVSPLYPNVAIADWEAFVPDAAVRLDGIHPDEGFESLESELLTPLLSQWRDAVAGDGATSCGREVVRATS